MLTLLTLTYVSDKLDLGRSPCDALNVEKYRKAPSSCRDTWTPVAPTNGSQRDQHGRMEKAEIYAANLSSLFER